VLTRFDVGDVVVSTKPLRQDGTYPDPDVAVGEVLVPAGVPGEVINVGLYLQEHIVYAVAFHGGRIVGCLERELEPPARPVASTTTAPGDTSP